MPDQNTILAALESAERSAPVCTVCGAPNVLTTHADRTIWLECAEVAEPKSTLRHWLTSIFPHDRREIVRAA